MKKVYGILQKSERLKRSRNLFGLVILLVLLMGCAFGTDRIKLYDPLTYKPTAEERVKLAYADAPEIKPFVGETIRLTIKKIKDNRPDISKIGVKKNSYGMVTGSVDVEKGVVFLDIFTNNLIKCFELAGYEVIPTKKLGMTSEADKENIKGSIDADIRVFWVEFMPGFWTVAAVSNVIFEIRLFESDTGREIWREIFRGEGKVSGMAVTRGMYEKSINIAYSEAMMNLYKAISDEKMRRIFKK